MATAPGAQSGSQPGSQSGAQEKPSPRGPVARQGRPKGDPRPEDGQDARPQRPRVLLVAGTAAPGGAGASLAAWSLARALTAVAEVHLVIPHRNRDQILRAGLAEGRDFTAITTGALASRLLQGADVPGGAGPHLLAALAHPGFEREVWRRFADDIRSGAYDIVHRLSPRSPAIGGPLAGHCARAGVPFVLGPVNGGAPWLPSLDAGRGAGLGAGRGAAGTWRGAWRARLDALARRPPGVARTLRHAAAILAGSHGTAAALATDHGARVVWLPDDGVDPQLFDGQSDPAPAPLRVCHIGRLERSRGPDILLEAAAPLLREGRMVLDIIGDGPLLPGLRALARREGFGRAVRFHGWLSQDDLRDVALQSAVLACPTLAGGGGAVVLEAMALGLAPVVVDHAGPGELVTEGVGYKVPPGDRAAIVAGLRRVLAGLAADPGGVAATGGSARARVRTHFTWAAKARQVGYVYDWLRGLRASPPVFYSPSQPILSYLPDDGTTEGDMDAVG